MRYYLINKKDESDQYVFDLIQANRLSPEVMEFEYSTLKKSKSTIPKKIYICKMAGRYFHSFDRKKWKKIPRQEIPDHIVNINKEYSLYRGFRPSSLSGANGEGLMSQMPGKIVDIYVKDNEKVKEGQPILALEAMKMENIIKSSSSGIVEKINVETGQTVEKGVLLVKIKSE